MYYQNLKGNNQFSLGWNNVNIPWVVSKLYFTPLTVSNIPFSFKAILKGTAIVKSWHNAMLKKDFAIRYKFWFEI